MAKTIEEIKADFSELTPEDLAENFPELFKANKAFAAAFDSRVSRGINSGIETGVAKALAEVEAAEGEKTAAEGREEADKARELALDRRERMITLSLDQGLDPATVISILGLDDGEDEARIAALAENNDTIIEATRKKLLKDNGRSPFQDIGLRTGGLDLAEWNKQPDEVIAANAEAVNDSITRAMDQSSGGGSLRQRVSRILRREK